MLKATEAEKSFQQFSSQELYKIQFGRVWIKTQVSRAQATILQFLGLGDIEDKRTNLTKGKTIPSLGLPSPENIQHRLLHSFFLYILAFQRIFFLFPALLTD